MADITFSLVCYKLKETYRSVGSGIDRFLDWYQDFSWKRVDLLDMLFLGWLLAAFLVVGAINLYLRVFGLPRSRKAIQNGSGDTPGRYGGAVSLSRGETCQWLNSTLSWLYLHYNNTPEIVDSWIRALNEQAKKHSDDLQIKFERIQSGSLPPKLTKITTDASSKDTLASESSEGTDGSPRNLFSTPEGDKFWKLSLHAGVEAADCTLLVSAMQSTATNLKVTSCDINLTKLQGQLRIHGDYSQETVQMTLTFAEPPEIILNVSTRNYDTALDKAEVERVVRLALGGAICNMNLFTHGGYPTYGSHSQPDFTSTANRTSMPPRSIPVLPSIGQSFNEISCTKRPLPFLSGLTRPQAKVKSPVSSSLPGVPQERRLLIKVIKANGLGDRDFGCTDPYCTVQMDHPPQSHTTSVVKNTVNPFWDEHFLFDFDENTRHVSFEVYDREKPSGDDFLGRATIAMEDLRRQASSRQIIPLTGRPRVSTTTSGSVTIEFLFVDGPEAAGVTQNAADSLSPRRRIETNTRVTPGGTTVTTTTTTTEKPRDHKLEPFYNDVPNLIERPDGLTYSTEEYSPYNSRGASNLEAHDAALRASPEHVVVNGANGGENVAQTALRELSKTPPKADRQRTPSKQSSTLIITSVQREPMTLPVIKTQEPGMYDDMHDGKRDTLSMSTASSDMHKEKKKSSFASAFKKRFSRPKKRSQSADRAYSSSFKESSLLKPPEHGDSGTHSRTAEDVDQLQEGGNLRKSRSHSFSNSLKRIFKKKKNKDGVSRESSLSRASGQASREGSVSHPSPYMSYREGDRQGSPGPEYDHGYMYSSSMPASASPISYQH